MKRFRHFFYLIALLPLFGIVSCGKDEDSAGAKSGGSKTIVLYDTGIEALNQQAWRAAIADFEKAHPDTTVDFHPIKDDDYGQGGILIAALRSRNPPDVYFEWAWKAVTRDATNGTALDLTPHLDAEWKASLDPRSWAGTDHGGKTYMIPNGFDVANIVFYRKKTLADNGIEPPTTWVDFVAACKKLKAAGVQPIVQGNQGSWPAGNWAAEMAAIYLGLDRYRQAGEKPPRVKLSDPGFERAVSLLKELHDAKAFNEDMNTLNDTEGIARFTAGSAAFIYAGAWIMDALQENGGGEVYGILPPLKLPDQPAENNYILANSTGYMVNTKCAHPELAIDLLKRYTSAAVQGIRVKGGLSSTSLGAQKEMVSPLQKTEQEILSKAHSTWIAAPDISWERMTAERFYEAVKQVVAGEAEPNAALEAADRDVSAALK